MGLVFQIYKEFLQQKSIAEEFKQDISRQHWDGWANKFSRSSAFLEISGIYGKLSKGSVPHKSEWINFLTS